MNIYKELKDIYTSKNSTCNDKAKTFRNIYKIFLDERTGNTTLDLSELQGKEINNPEIKEKATKLVRYLNKVIHSGEKGEPKITVSKDDLKGCYRKLLVIIENITGEKPDEISLILSGIQKEWYVLGLNPEQKSAVVDDSQIINVNAGPGTGKTHLLVHKMMYYLKDNPDRNVVALSFTKTTAKQLQKKFIQELEECGKLEECDKSNVKFPHLRNHTIHSFCYQLLYDYYGSINRPFNYEFMDDSDIPDIIYEIAIKYGITMQEEKDIIKDILEKGEDNIDLKGKIHIIEIVREYKKEHNFIRIAEILKIFLDEANDENFLTWLKGKVDCLLIDESQDLSSKIYKIINLFVKINPAMQMFFVGDPRQSIFGFNGGSFKNFEDFKKKLNKEIKDFSLTLTYRCPQVVIEKINQLKFIDCNNPPLQLVNKSLAGTCDVHEAFDKQDEAKYILQTIKNINDNENTCILCRNLQYLEDIAEKLNEAGMPFDVKGGKSSLLPVIRMVNDCLKWTIQSNENSCGRLKKNNELYEFCNNKQKKGDSLSIPDFIREITDFLFTNKIINSAEKEVLCQYANKALKYDTLKKLLNACSSEKNDEFAEFHENKFKVKCKTKETKQNPSIILSTIHSAKGLEWKNVFLVGAADNILPSWSCFKEGSIEESREKLNEDKKLYYVAVTRCKENLYITYAKYINGRKYELSDFVKDSFEN